MAENKAEFNPLVPSIAATNFDFLDLSCFELVELPLNRKKPKHLRVRLPWRVISLVKNSLTTIYGLVDCYRLLKLDLSFNQLAALPNREFWGNFTQLRVLLLHNNKISSMHYLKDLSVMKNLTILTLYDNPISSQPLYRHTLVNLFTGLKLLDDYIVSDEELIEHVSFGRFGKFQPDFKFKLKLFNPEVRQYRIYCEEIKTVVRKHSKLSPVLTIQRYYRGFLVRRALTVFNISAAVIQRAWRKWKKKKQLRIAKNSSRLSAYQQRLGVHTIYLFPRSEIDISIFLQLAAKYSNIYRSARLEKTRIFCVRFSEIESSIIFKQKSRFNYTCKSVLELSKIKRRGFSCSRKSLENISFGMDFGSYKSLLIFRADSTYHDALLLDLHNFNEKMDDETKRLLIYPGPLIKCIAAAVSIQSLWRGHKIRKQIKAVCQLKIRILRSCICIQRWFRQHLFLQRMKMFSKLRVLLHNYEQQKIPKLRLDLLSHNGSNSDSEMPFSNFPTTFYVDPVLFSLMINSSSFIKSKLFPEHDLKFENVNDGPFHLRFSRDKFQNDNARYPIPSWLGFYTSKLNFSCSDFFNEKVDSNLIMLALGNKKSLVKSRLLVGSEAFTKALQNPVYFPIPPAISNLNTEHTKWSSRSLKTADTSEYNNFESAESASKFINASNIRNRLFFSTAFPDYNTHACFPSSIDICLDSNNLDLLNSAEPRPHYIEVTFPSEQEAAFRISLLYIFTYDPKNPFVFSDYCMNSQSFKSFIANSYRPFQPNTFEKPKLKPLLVEPYPIISSVQRGKLDIAKTQDDLFSKRFFSDYTKKNLVVAGTVPIYAIKTTKKEDDEFTLDSNRFKKFQSKLMEAELHAREKEKVHKKLETARLIVQNLQVAKAENEAKRNEQLTARKLEIEAYKLEVEAAMNEKEKYKESIASKVNLLKNNWKKTSEEKILDRRLHFREKLSQIYEDEKYVFDLNQRRKFQDEQRVLMLRQEANIRKDLAAKSKDERKQLAEFSRVHNVMTKQVFNGQLFRSLNETSTVYKDAVNKRKIETTKRNLNLEKKIFETFQEHRAKAAKSKAEVKRELEKVNTESLHRAQQSRLKSQHDRQLRNTVSLSLNTDRNQLDWKSLQSLPSLSRNTSATTPRNESSVILSKHEETKIAYQISALENMADKVRTELLNLTSIS